MSSKTFSFLYELLVSSRGSFCMDLCSLGSVEALSQPCHLYSHNQVCFFQILTTLLKLSHENLLHQAKRNIQFFLLSIVCRADSTSPVEHELNTSQASSSPPVPSVLLPERLEPKPTKMQTLSPSRRQQSPLLRAALGKFLTWHFSSIPWKMRVFHRVHPLQISGHCRHLSKLSPCGAPRTPYGTHSSCGRNRFVF